nr:hypothetical protein [Parvularcula marina]
MVIFSILLKRELAGAVKFGFVAGRQRVNQDKDESQNEQQKAERLGEV